MATKLVVLAITIPSISFSVRSRNLHKNRTSLPRRSIWWKRLAL